jgi:hypothetical protein
VRKSHNDEEKASITPVYSDVVDLLESARKKYQVITGELRSEKSFNTWLFQEMFNSIDRYGKNYVGLDSSFIFVYKMTHDFYYKFVPYVRTIRDLKRDDLLFYAEIISKRLDFIKARDVPTLLSFIFPRNVSLINQKNDGGKYIVSISQTADVEQEKFKLIIEYVTSLLGSHLEINVDNVSGFHGVIVVNDDEEGKKGKDNATKLIPVSEGIVILRDKLMKKFNLNIDKFRSSFSSTVLSQAIRIFNVTGITNISQTFDAFMDFSDSGYSLLPCPRLDETEFHVPYTKDLPKVMAILESLYPGIKIILDKKEMILIFPFSVDGDMCPRLSEQLKEMIGESNLKEKINCKGHIISLKML